MFSQVRLYLGGHFTHDSGKEEASGSRSGVDREVPLAEGDPPRRGDGAGVKDLQLSNYHDCESIVMALMLGNRGGQQPRAGQDLQG